MNNFVNYYNYYCI